MDDDLVERLWTLVETVPAGRVTTYGALADALTASGRRCGPRLVGRVLATGGGVPWWRVVRADGSLPAHLRAEAHAHWVAEGVAVRPSGRVDLTAVFWQPAGELSERGDGVVS